MLGDHGTFRDDAALSQGDVRLEDGVLDGAVVFNDNVAIYKRVDDFYIFANFTIWADARLNDIAVGFNFSFCSNDAII